MDRIKSIDLVNTTQAYFATATVTPAGGLVHIAGQVGNTKDGTVPDDYESQIHLALFNLRRVIISAGATVKDIAKLTLYVVNYEAANRKHVDHIRRFLEGHRPAITLVPVPKLAVASWLIEIDAVVSQPEPSPPPHLPAATETHDVIIIGAGLAGLTAAHEILRSGPSCVVLEARNRVGGKTWSVPLADGKGIVDLGAAWINDTSQSKVYALAKRYGAELIKQNTDGKAVLQDKDGSCSSFDYGDLPQFDSSATRKNVGEIRDIVEADCQAVDSWRPVDTSLDALTFEAYLRTRGASDAAQATAKAWTRAMLGKEPREVSALFFLNYCKSGGGLLQMRSDRRGGGQYLRIRQGTQLLSQGLASSLPKHIVRLSTPVSLALQENERFIKVEAVGKVYSGRKVITTIPGASLKSISFFPKLSPVKRAWSESMTNGYYTKAMLQFSSPFWVESGFCGLAHSFVGPAAVVRDTSSPEDHKYLLTCFMTGAPGRFWAALCISDRESALLTQLGKLFGVDDLKDQFVQVSCYEWSLDEYSGRGCPSASLTPGVLDALGGDGLREPCGSLHFAGTETAVEWKGYMEGAIRSGERAAAEVLSDLNCGIISRI